MLISGVQQSDSVIHIHISILFQILIPFRLLQNIEHGSLCYTVGPSWLSTFKYSSVYMSIPNSQFIHMPHLSFLVTISLFTMSVCLFLFCKEVHLYHFFFFLDSTYKWYHMIFVFFCLTYFT